MFATLLAKITGVLFLLIMFWDILFRKLLGALV